MARGQRGARSANAGNQKQNTEEEVQNSNKSARNRRSKNVQDDEAHRAIDEAPVSHTSASVEAKRDHHPVKAAPQPTSEQLMIAQLIGGDNKADDPNQRQKIQKVMDFTGLEEDAVATALFDAQWDEQRAIELLLEESEQLTAWEETGSKKKKNKNKQAADEAAKDDWDDGDNFPSQDNREKSRSRGPPRMRRGGSQAQSGNRNRDFDDQQPPLQGGNQSRGLGPRRGDGPARRGGPGGSRGGGGGRSFQSRQPKPDMQSNTSGTAAFSGSIDTWNNPASSASGSTAPDRTAGSTGGDAAPAGPKRMSRNSGGGKDAFDNAGNWGDDFPAADDWDNEEYTGSLADTKVFTARSSIGPGPAKPPTAAAVVASRPQEPTQTPQPTPPQPQQPPPSAIPPSTTVIGQNRSFSSTVNGPPPAVSASPGVPPTSSYSQSIDLSTLLQKPATQSTLSSPPLQQQQQSLLQFNQQATDSLRAGLGIGQNSSNKAPGNLNSYSAYANSASAYSSNPPSSSFGQGSAFTSIKPSQSPSSSGSPNIQQRTAPPPQQPKGPAPPLGMPPASSSAQVRPRMPPSSKIPSSAVEMPGDNVGQLDVQFGGLDLKFGSGSTIGLPSVSMPSAATVPSMPASSAVTPSMPSVTMPSVSMPAKQISNGYPSSSSVLPKSAVSSSATGSVSVKPGQQQQQHQSDSLGSYSSYGSYGQQQSKPSYHHQYQNQYSGYSDQSSYQSSSTSGYGNQNSYSSSSTPSSGYKSSGNQYQHDSLNKFESMSSSTSSMAVNNAAAAVLGLTTTTNALTGKVSATTAGKVPNVPNLPPGVASMLPQHFMTSLPPAAYYGIQQPSAAAAAMYSAYGSGLDDLAALQRTAGLHTLVGASNNPTVPQPGGMKAPSSGYYDPSNQYAAGSLGGSRNDGSSNLNSQLGSNASATTASGSSGSNINSDKTGFGASVAVSSTDSNSSPIPSTGLQSGQSQQQQQQQQQQQAAAQQASFNLAASNAFAAQQHMPPGYAYFYGGVPNLQAYGAATAATGYPGALTVPTAGGGSSTSQFQKTYGYSSGYDNLGQAGNKDFSSSYSAGNAAGKSSAGGSQAPNPAGHQYWGNSPLAGQLW